MKSIGVNPPDPPTAEEKATKQAALVQAKKDADKKIDEMSEEELIDYNHDNMKIEKTKK